MCWRRQARTMTYFGVITLVVSSLLVPQAPVRCSEHTVIPFSYMNKTIRDQMRKHKFLNEMMGKLLESDTFIRNSSVSKGALRGGLSPRSQENTHFNTQTQSHLFYNISGADRLITDKSFVPKDYASRFSPPNLVYSESIDKNVLTFRFKSVRNNTLVNRINLWLYVWTQDNKDKSSSASSMTSAASSSPKTRDLQNDERRSRRHGKRIKIRVFLTDANGFRGQRIAELKTRIDSSSWGKLGLPVSLMNTLADKDTLRLRVECKRCTRKTQLILPDNADSKRCKKRQRVKKKKKEKKRMRRWRKHCSRNGVMNEKLFPFLVIEERNRGSHGRFKRSPETKAHFNKTKMNCFNYNKSNEENVVKNTFMSTPNVHNCCTSVNLFVDFVELGLDQLIVYPSGFEFVTCIDDCSNTSTSFLDQLKSNLQRVIHFASRKIRNHRKKPPRHSLQTNHASMSSFTEYRHKKQQLPLQSHHHHNRHRHSRRVQWRKHKWSRLKTTSQSGCQPVEWQNLVILHFTHEHTLAHLELPRFLVTKCGCRNYLPLNKN